MIYVSNKLNHEERRFLDSEIEAAIGTFKTLVRAEGATYVAIEWVRNDAVLLPDRPLDDWGT